MDVRTRVVAVLTAVISVLVIAGPPRTASGHVGAFGPEQRLITRGGTMGISVDAVTAPDGRVLAYVSVAVPPYVAGSASVIRFLTGRGSQWRFEQTPYRGDVMAVAQDTTGSYVLYRVPAGVRIAKRLRGGQYTPGHLLDSTPAVTSPDFGGFGDVVAHAGRWWALWTAEPRDSSWVGVLEAGTFGGSLHRGRVTDRRDATYDPSLTLVPVGGRHQAVAVWSRGRWLGPSDIWLGHASQPGQWRARRYITAGTRNVTPQVVRYGRTLHVAWLREGALWYGRDRGRGLLARRVTAAYEASGGPRLAVTRGEPFVLWPAKSSLVLLSNAAGADGRWRTVPLWSNSYDWRNFALTTAGGLATAFVGASKSGELLVRSQEPPPS